MEEEEGTRGPEEGHILIRIHVPELNVQKCLQFPRDQLVWDVKQQCLASLPKELKESFNYGLFYPPENGRAGKFLDEERRLGDYPFNGPVGYLELKYKRRVYKMISLDEKQLKSLHTRANLRRFLDYVQNDQVEKITKMCSKGLDPNFHCQDSGETPLTIATGIKKPARGLIALVNGGALLDYRTKDGSTAMHRSVEHRNLEALRTLLELGASSNYKDSKGLTPLYYCVSTNIDPAFTETLLHDHATTGAQDVQGWQEVHQACKNGLLAHLEHLLFYGADMNARNASGNTPLHVCAVNGQESCTRHLLFRGADPKALNYANQTPCQVAVIAGNMDLADLIQNYKPEDVVPFRGLPSYNPKRRSAIGWLQRVPSMSTLATLPPSPCPSDRSLAPFSSASSSLSDGSIPPSHETDTASIVTEKSLGDTSDIISDSSGVGTSNSDTTNCSISITGSTVVCIESYCSKEKGHISIREGDIIEVTGATDDGYLEGNVRSASNRNGYFPAHCVQEVRLRHHNNQPPMIIPRDYEANYRILGRRESTCKQFATAPRAAKKTYSNLPVEPRTVVLHKGKKGFGFILRGAKATSPLMELTPSEKCTALQYLDDVDPGGIADMAGLKKGDFLLEINKEDVSSASHEHVVDLIRNSGDLVQMTVISLGVPACILPMSKSTNLTSGIVDLPTRRHYATLPRKMNSPGGIANRSSQAPLPPRRDPKTTLSVGRARAKSMVAGLADTNETDITKSTSAGTIHKSVKEMSNSAPVQPKTASIRQRPTSSRGMTHSTLVELFQNEKNLENISTNNACHIGISQFQENPKALNSTRKGRVYASVAEMKRINSKYSKTKVPELSAGKSELKRNFHSTPDLVQDMADLSATTILNKFHKSQEDISVHTHRNLPPPTHPPPPIPPQTQVVQVDICTGKLSEYDTLNRITLEEGILSSFRPTSNAKLYASPEDVKTVGYRSKSLPSHSSRSQIRKSQSMRTAINNYSNTDKSKQQSNPYAQPTRASRSQTLGIQNRRNKLVSSKSTTDIKSQSCIPSIPEPDYSCSDSEEGESEEDRKKIHCIVNRINCLHLQQPENSGNSITSGSSSGCNSGAPNFSVEEIQRGRMLLRSSKSYPENLLKKHKELEATLEDGDNSSSGVSSDQEITSGGNLDYNETINHEHNSMTLPSTKGQRQQIGLLKRQAVSLAQLPPPIENENDEKDEFCLPPPPEFGENTTSFCEEIVVAPPPQFSDRQISRVRIVGSVPKTMNTSDEMKQS